MILSDLRTYARDLTGVYETALISDTTLDLWFNEAYSELNRLEKWLWLPAAALTSGTAPAFAAEFHTILAYRVAVKLLMSQADDTQRADYYTKEYAAMLEAMRQEYFPKLATAFTNSRAQMRDYVRDITGVQSDRVSDAMINQWLQETYQTVAGQRSWDWLESTAIFADVSTVGPHLIGEEYVRVLSVRFIDDNGEIEEVLQRPDTLSVHSNRRAAYYTFDDASGEIVLSPTERFDGTEEKDMVVRYSRQKVVFTSDASMPEFDSQFNPMLAYAVAAPVLRLVGGPNAERADSFDQMSNEMFNDMVMFYELSHDDTAFQMGIEGRETQQYPYWFRRY